SGYNVPPQNGAAYPQNGGYPNNSGYNVPPQNGAAYPQNGGYPNNSGYNAPPQNGAAYPQKGGYPNNSGYNAPPQNGAAYPRNGGYPNNGGYNAPPQNGAAYPRNGGYPNNGGYNAPPQNGAAYPQNSGYPNNNGYNAPPQNGAAYPRNGSSYNGNRPNGNQAPPRRPSGQQKNGAHGSAPAQAHRPVQKKRRTKRPLWQTILRVVLIGIIVLFLLYSGIVLIGILRTNIVATAERSRTADAMASRDVEHILVIGTDSRDVTEDRGRSDSMILVSLNSETNTIYMTSFLRDVYVYINDTYGYGKLNAAYSYGGPELLMDTIEANYRIKIDDYVIISFAACSAMIDAVGGVEITLSDQEAQALNEILISEVNELMGDGRNDDLLDGGGTYTLSGKQALSYSRIRYVGNADFERTSRQRAVFSQVLEKASHNPLALVRILLNALPEVSTNLSGLDIYEYAWKAPYLLLAYDVAQQQIPVENSFYGDTINGESVLVTDFTENHRVLYNTVFKDAA
ncbi:MAG: LCP family protein, partial [Ruminococcus sp.]